MPLRLTTQLRDARSRRPARTARRGAATAAACCCLLWLACGGCDRDMYDQPKYRPPEQPSTFFEDGQSARPLVPGTVARTESYPDRSSQPGHFETKVGDDFPPDFPKEGEALRRKLVRGQDRYTIYCSVCHGQSGAGDGMIVQRGFTKPPAYTVQPEDKRLSPDRYRREQFLETAPPGHFYDVMTNGFGAMYSYADRVSPDDRWAIVAYVRALQLVRAKPSPMPPAGSLGPDEAKTHNN